MSAQINETIPVSGFEQVSNAIGATLLVELTNQKALQPFDEPVNVYTGRMIPFDPDEQVIINITLAHIAYSNWTQVSRKGANTYFIDIDVNGKDIPALPGKPALPAGLDSDIRLQKFVRLVGYILSSPKTKWLGFSPGLLESVFVEKAQFSVTEPREDSNFTRFARITYTVNLVESQEGFTGSQLFGADAMVSLDETDKGYKFVFNSGS